MSALFACTRCAKRHPFEDLSEVEQLCKECRNNFPIVKCTYCRSEFQQNDKNGVNSICRKCAQNVKAYGKPTACEYCNIIAAFIGKRCQRCSNSEKRWGPPKICEQCKQQCAFERGTDTRRKGWKSLREITVSNSVEGKLLCWLCTMSYKRVLVKTMKAREFNKSMKSSSGGTSSAAKKSSNASSKTTQIQGVKFRIDEEPYSPGSGYPTADDTTQDSSTPYSPGSMLGSALLEEAEKNTSAANTPSARSDHMTPGSSSQTSWTKENKEFPRSASTLGFKHKLEEDKDRLSDLKKIKLDKSANGVSIMKSSSMSDFGHTENIVQMTQMKEKIEALKKQLATKDAQIHERDKKVTELKAQNCEAEKKMRERMESLQKSHHTALSNLQTKNRELTKQVQTLSKSSKKS